MIIFNFDWDEGDARNIWWLANTSITNEDKAEADNIYEQIAAHEAHLDE